MIDEAHLSELHSRILAAFNIADWIYHDVRLDIDGEAYKRAVDRLYALHSAHGRESLYGMAGAWAIKACWRRQDAYQKLGRPYPSLTPGDMVESVSCADEYKRAYVSAQQLIAAVAASDFEMAEAIFNAAYDASVHEAIGLLLGVLLLSIYVSNKAKKMGTSDDQQKRRN